MSVTLTLDAAGISQEFALQPGKSVTYLADTTDLDSATVTLEVSENGTIWTRARDSEGVLVAILTGDGSALSETALLRNENTFALRYRAVVAEVAELAGEVAVSFTDEADKAAITDVTTVTDASVEFPAEVSVIVAGVLDAQNTANIIIVPIHANNAAAVAAGLPVGALWATALGVVAAVVE
jgi:hypothetical protein